MSTAHEPRLGAARSLLFVPGDRPERFDKAVATGADAVIIDLEDAVAPDAKEAARAHAVAWLAGGGRAVVRINGVDTAWHAADVAALRATGAPVMVPKAESSATLAELAASLRSGCVIALIETARGVAELETICGTDGVVRIALGNVDLSAELGVDPASHAALAYVRGRMVLASAVVGMPPPIDGVTTDFDSADALDRDLAHGKELGFGGKLCIHPRQVPFVNTALLPTAAELDWAERVLAAAADQRGVIALDGVMIDAPVVRRAERIAAHRSR